MTTPKNAPQTSRPSISDRDKQYVSSYFQQGRAVVDVNVNAALDFARYQTEGYHLSDSAYEGPETRSNEFRLIPVTNADDGANDRNRDNCAITLGRLRTRMGVIEALTNNANVADYAIFDYGSVVDNSAVEPEDRGFANYMFKGHVTGLGAGEDTKLIDENKRFLPKHRLAGTDVNDDISGTEPADAVSPEQTDIGTTSIRFRERPCRVRFLTGANADEEVAISSVDSEITLSLDSALPNPVSEGDEYVILPGNGLQSQRADYDSSTSAETIAGFGLSGSPYALFYIHVWHDTVSADEDPDLLDPNVGKEITNHVQLRWCLRIANVWHATSNDAGYTLPRSTHLQTLRERLNKRRLGRLNGPDDSRQRATSEQEGNSSRTRALDEASYNSGSGITALHNLTLENQDWGSAEHGEFLLNLFETFALSETNASGSDVLTLALQAPQPKADDGDVLSSYWYPNVPDTTSSGIVPRFNSYPIDVGEVSCAWFCRIPVLLPLRQVTKELVASRGIEAKRVAHRSAVGQGNLPNIYDGFGGSSVLVEEHSGMSAPLLYEDMPHRLSHMENMVRGYLGLGQSLGATSDKRLGSEFRIASGSVRKIGRDFFSAASTEPVVFQPASTDHLVNPHNLLSGRVHEFDVLSTDGYSNTEDWQFLSGPGKYFLRDGTEILPDHDDGWSFYKYPLNTSGVLSVASTDLEVRAPDEGIIQASAVNKNLNFRKLALKSTVSMTSELFTFDISHPLLVKASNGDIEGYGSATAPGYSGVGAFLDTSYTHGNIGPEMRESYAVGGLDAGESSWSADGSEQPGHVPAHPVDPQTRGTVSIENNDQGGIEMDKRYGPWGRFDALSDNEFIETNPLDTWENRCTAARLRYHIGDYYPAPDGSNALVDNLQLFVRIEPLSLVHWATMPKHQHSVIEDSILSWDGIIDFLQYMSAEADTTGLVDSDGIPKINETSPDYDPSANGGSGNAGETSWETMPFANKHQPFVHWYHPMQEYVLAPFPEPDETDSAYSEAFSPYTKWGERSLIVTGIVSSASDGSVDVTPNDFHGPPMSGRDGLSNDAWEDSSTSSFAIGTHNRPSSGQVDFAEIDMDGGGTILVNPDRMAFPFVPKDPSTSGSVDEEGVPGPVFLPAFYNYCKVDDDGAENGFNEAFTNIDAAIQGTISAETPRGDGEWLYFPRKDHASEPIGWGSAYGDAATNTPSPSTPGSAYNWEYPVLRAGIRTDTVAAVHELFDGVIAVEDRTETTYPGQNQTQPLSGPDANTDTAFMGDSGTSIAVRNALNPNRPHYLNPMVLGGAWKLDEAGKQVAISEYGDEIVNDIFHLASEERYRLSQGGGSNASSFTPLIGTFAAIRYMGLQQKLMWNSSIRVLHTRPGGGYRGIDGATSRRKTSQPPKSLTELFIVRDRQTGEAVPMPSGPKGPSFDTDVGGAPVPGTRKMGNKPFLHLESMHPAAGSVVTIKGQTTSVHPNHNKLGHLYPMVVDSMGMYGEAAGTGSDALYEGDDWADHAVRGAHFVEEETYTGATGDTYSADPFDSAFAESQDPGGKRRVAKTDRNHQNSGVEIDLYNELRYVRENAGQHNLTATGFDGSVSWLDLMPTADELVEPGDHEIVFVLYTGKYGQQMVDDEVPYGFNAPFAGCKITATVDVNRSAENVPSEGGPAQHYGNEKEVWNVLGHK